MKNYINKNIKSNKDKITNYVLNNYNINNYILILISFI